MTIVRTLRIVYRHLIPPGKPIGMMIDLTQLGGNSDDIISWEQGADAAMFDSRTFAVLRLGEAKMAERACYAACRKDPSNRALMTAWREAKYEVTRKEKLAVAACEAMAQ